MNLAIEAQSGRTSHQSPRCQLPRVWCELENHDDFSWAPVFWSAFQVLGESNQSAFFEEFCSVIDWCVAGAGFLYHKLLHRRWPGVVDALKGQSIVQVCVDADSRHGIGCSRPAQLVFSAVVVELGEPDPSVSTHRPE